MKTNLEKTKIKEFALVLSLVLFGNIGLFAQQNELPKYQRSSLHMVLLTTDEPRLTGSIDFDKEISEAWQSYPFPDKYDQHEISFKEAYGGKPKGTFMELVNKYQGGFGSLSIAQLKEISATIKDNKNYNKQLIDTTTNMLKEKKIGQQLLAKWFGIQEDGSYSLDLLEQRSAYNASQAAVADASATTRGVRAIMDRSYDLIGNTFISFSKLAFYENEPIASFSKNLAYAIAAFAGPAASAAQAAADVAYTATHEGYSAYATTVLYRLDWNDSIQAVFDQCWTDDNKIDMQKFYAIDFPFELVGVEKTTTTTIDAKGGFANAIGVKGAKPKDELIKQTIIRNLDKVFAALQYNYDVFKPLVPIISTEPLLADVGMKESIKDGDKFELLEARYDEKTNKIKYNSVGTVKVVKGKVWDNRYSLLDEDKKNEEGVVKGTELTKNKKAALGMVVRQVTKKKKK